MGPTYFFEIGQRFGRLVVLEDIGKPEDKTHYYYKVKCDCGVTKIARATALAHGRIRSCGCLTRETTSKRVKIHGKSQTKTFHIWAQMHARCKNPNSQRYLSYGGRGIKVDEAWNEYLNFLKDMGECPGNGFSIDRINNDGNYEPGNCRWASNKEQSRNTSRNVIIEHNGRKQCMQDWSIETGIPANTIHYRLKNGYSIAEALSNKKSWSYK